jgi:hypothetical protein
MQPKAGWVAVLFAMTALLVPASRATAATTAPRLRSRVAPSAASTTWSGELLLDGFGGLHHVDTFGPVPTAVFDAPSWPGWDIARGVALRADQTGGFVLDGFGGLHWFSLGTRRRAPAVFGAAFWPGWDIAQGVALMPDGSGGFTVDGFGGLHWFSLGTPRRAPAVFDAPFWPGWDIARGVAILPDGSGGFVLDGWGAVHWFSIGSRRPAVRADPDAWRMGVDHACGLAFDSAQSAVLFDADSGYLGFGVGPTAGPPGADWIAAPRLPDGVPIRDGAA